MGKNVCRRAHGTYKLDCWLVGTHVPQEGSTLAHGILKESAGT